MLCICICCAMLLTGCKDNVPNFQLDISGTVAEAKTNITTEFKVATTNVMVYHFANYDTQAFPVLTQKAFPDAYQWVKSRALANVPNGAKYDITVAGYVEWFGVKLSIDEHWKNPE